ncbi:MAG TPA: redoxin domain-containing protein [Cytophagales bacterium]|nr:redoxin domain-containing protein [Cytophagales bacterium]
MLKNFGASIVLFFLIFHVSAQEMAAISVNITNPTVDTLSCTLTINSITKNKTEIKIARKNNSFSTSFPISYSTFLTISDGKNIIEGIVEPNDKISIDYDSKNFDSTLVFSGRGSKKMELCRNYKEALTLTLSEKIKSYSKSAKSFESYYGYVDSLENALLKNLEEVMFSISSASYNLLKGEIKGVALLNRYYGLERILNQNLQKVGTSVSAPLSAKTKNELKNLINFNNSYYLSPCYLKGVYYVLAKEYEGLLSSGKIKKGLEEKYKYLNSKLDEKFKVPVLSKFILADMEEENDQEGIYSLITKTFANHSTSEFKPFMEREFELFRIGKKAPDFTVEDLDGKKVSLSDLKGKVVYLSFWFSGNSPSHTLINKLKVVKEHFKDNNNVVFLSVSIDSREVLYRTVTSYKIQGYHCFTEGKGMDHPIISLYKVTRFPKNCIIDKTGNFYSTLPPDSPLELIPMIDNAISEPKVVRNKNN